MAFQKMEIDFDIYKLIEAERRGFDEPQYIALRRLLKLPANQPTTKKAVQPSSSGAPWRGGGIEVPHGSLARMRYNYDRDLYEGQFLDGQLVVKGQKFRSLSTAATELAGKSLNGWLYWEAQFPGVSEWVRLGDMRDPSRQ